LIFIFIFIYLFIYLFKNCVADPTLNASESFPLMILPVLDSTSTSVDKTASTDASNKVCFGWRQTKDCDPNGPRHPRLDKGCDVCVSGTASGFCECQNNTRVDFTCGHEHTTCQHECWKIVVGKGKADTPSPCKLEQAAPESRIKKPPPVIPWTFEGVGPEPPVHFESACTIQAPYGQWDPWSKAGLASCGNPLFKAHVNQTHIVITAPIPSKTCAKPECSLGKSKHSQYTQFTQSATSQTFLIQNYTRSLLPDYATCRCELKGPVQYLALLSMPPEEAINRVKSFVPKRPTEGYNVVYVMIDALSRAHFFRALNGTVSLAFVFSLLLPRALRMIPFVVYLHFSGMQATKLKSLRESGRFEVYDFEQMHTLGAFSPPNRWASFSGYPPFFADVKVRINWSIFIFQNFSIDWFDF
jgi:hypothetical protein